jgi:hypothetical protein
MIRGAVKVDVLTAARFFGLELVEPGVVSCSRWRPAAMPWG